MAKRPLGAPFGCDDVTQPPPLAGTPPMLYVPLIGAADAGGPLPMTWQLL